MRFLTGELICFFRACHVHSLTKNDSVKRRIKGPDAQTRTDISWIRFIWCSFNLSRLSYGIIIARADAACHYLTDRFNIVGYTHILMVCRRRTNQYQERDSIGSSVTYPYKLAPVSGISGLLVHFSAPSRVAVPARHRSPGRLGPSRVVTMDPITMNW